MISCGKLSDNLLYWFDGVVKQATMEQTVRRHDIDWLRVILFGLLVPFHVAIGVYWSTYGLEINPNIDDLAEQDRLEFVEENNDYSADSVTPESMFLHWMHQWRLAALFMISGMGTAFAFRRRVWNCLLYTSPSPRDRQKSRMPSSA